MYKFFIAVSFILFFSAGAEAKRLPTRHHAAPQRHITPPAFSTKSYIVADMDGQILKEMDANTVRPIASISKLMVGLLASEQNMDEELSIPATRSVQSSIPRGTKSLPRKEILSLALIKSDNFAAQILCEHIDNCIEKMNARAVEIGMINTHFDEPTGLSINNVSTATDLLKLLIVAYDRTILTQISSKYDADIPVNHRIIKIRNTNPLTARMDILLSKTGFTNPAGGCLVMIINSVVGRRVLILLGSKNAHTRIPDMEKLVKEL